MFQYTAIVGDQHERRKPKNFCFGRKLSDSQQEQKSKTQKPYIGFVEFDGANDGET